MRIFEKATYLNTSLKYVDILITSLFEKNTAKCLLILMTPIHRDYLGYILERGTQFDIFENRKKTPPDKYCHNYCTFRIRLKCFKRTYLVYMDRRSQYSILKSFSFKYFVLPIPNILVIGVR